MTAMSTMLILWVALWMLTKELVGLAHFTQTTFKH